MRSSAGHAFFACALVALAGCDLSLSESDADPDVEPPSYGPCLGTAENPVPRDDVTYAVRSRIERGGGDGEVAAAVASVRSFSESPAAALLSADLLEIDQLYAALPTALASQLEGWIDVELAKATIGGKPVIDYAASVTDYAQTALTRFTVDSTMSFKPLRAAHTMTGLAFALADVNVIVPIGGLKADAFEQQVATSVGERGVITFGDHQFGLAFGEHVWQGLNLASQTVFGVDVRTAFVDKIDCAGLSSAVAARCVDSQCVGHQPELETICSRSLDMLVTDLSTRIGAFDSDVIHYAGGTALLVDDNRDGLANRIADGIWDSQLVTGPAKGTFTASAEGR